MCPACIASVALVAAGVMSTGGLTALVTKKFHPKTIANDRGSFDSRNGEDRNTESSKHGKEQL